MADPRVRLRGTGPFRLAVLLLAIVAVGTAIGSGRDRLMRPEPIRGGWARVRRVDLDTTLLAGGDLQAAGQTSLSCQVEDTKDAGPMTLVELIDNGTAVKKGDILCRIDSSGVEESIRLQLIATEQARASHRQAELTLDVARLALREYQEGIIAKTNQDYRGQVALKRSDAQRQVDRLAWAEGMYAKGYLSMSDLGNERFNRAKSELDLRKVAGEFDAFRRYTAPKEVLSRQHDIEKATANLRFEESRLRSQETRLDGLRKSFEQCTIRAPRDGIALHASSMSWRFGPIEEGGQVRRGQELITMPDDAKMEVDVSVHETMGSRVRVGAPTKIRVWGRPERVYPGRVAGMNLFPIPNWKEWDENLRHYIVRVKFDEAPTGLLPLMSASVEFDTGRVSDALVIPVAAMEVFEGRSSCRVAGPDGLERRPISVGQASRDLLEVTDGLEAGEVVYLPPTR